MTRVYNFSAGPATLPLPVLESAKEDLVEYKDAGMSVMEMSHRGKDFSQILQETKQDLIDLLDIPDSYEIMFMQGGATLQFAAIPLNLMKNKKADYIVTGSWSKKAVAEAKMYGDINIVASSEDKNYSYVPQVDDLDFDENADYIYICENETIHGNRFHQLPDTGNIPLVSDVSSMFLSEKHDVKKYGLLYGGVQKNIGPAGLSIAIVRKDLLRDDLEFCCPTIMNYKKIAEADSCLNTPNCFGIYMCGLTFKWLKEQGGLDKVKEKNIFKANLLYNYLDSSELFNSTVSKESRSYMNIPFVTGNDELDAKFISEAANAGLKSLKGHRSVGGMRASIYNAMPLTGVQALVDFMQDFESKNI